MLETLAAPEFWIGLGVIIWVNIILSGDNAVVIALAARSLPKHQQKQAIFWGAGAAVVLRIILTIVAVKLLEFPFLKLVGGAALLWIAVKLLVPATPLNVMLLTSADPWTSIRTSTCVIVPVGVGTCWPAAPTSTFSVTSTVIFGGRFSRWRRLRGCRRCFE